MKKHITFLIACIIMSGIGGCKMSGVTHCPGFSAKKEKHFISAAQRGSRHSKESNQKTALVNTTPAPAKNNLTASTDDKQLMVKLPKLFARTLPDEEIQIADQVFKEESGGKVSLVKSADKKIYIKADSK